MESCFNVLVVVCGNKQWGTVRLLLAASGDINGFFLYQTVQATFESHPAAVERVPWLFRGVKRPGRECDHLPLSGAGDKNEWSCTSVPPSVSMACTGKTLPFLRKNLT
jgi:hypothetical protein